MDRIWSVSSALSVNPGSIFRTFAISCNNMKNGWKKNENDQTFESTGFASSSSSPSSPYSSSSFSLFFSLSVMASTPADPSAASYIGQDGHQYDPSMKSALAVPLRRIQTFPKRHYDVIMIDTSMFRFTKSCSSGRCSASSSSVCNGVLLDRTENVANISNFEQCLLLPCSLRLLPL